MKDKRSILERADSERHRHRLLNFNAEIKNKNLEKIYKIKLSAASGKILATDRSHQVKYETQESPRHT